MYKPIAQRIEDINNTPQLTGVSKVMSPSIKKYKPISKRDENKSIALNLSKPDITETTNRDFSSPTFSFSVPQTTAQTTEQFREGGSFVEDIPSFAKAVGQSIGNSVLSVAIDMHNNARPDKYIDKIDITGTTFWDEFSRRITGKTELKSLADQVIDTEQEIKKWKKEVQLGLDSGNLTPVESASAKAFLSFKPEILAFAGVVGSTGLDLTPFGGIEKNLYKTIAKTALKGSEETALTLLKRVGVADDLALQGAKDMVLFVKDEKSAKKFFENIVKLQTETKSSKPLQGYISVKKRDSYISPQNIKINDSKIFDTASNIAKSKNPKEIYELLIKLGIDKDVSLNLTPKLVNQKDEKFIYSLLEKTKKDNISFKPRTLDTGQESAVLDELSKTDTKPLHITGNVDYLHKFSDVSSPEQMRLEELKIKAENKNLTKAEIVEADVLLRKRNIDAIKIADERLKVDINPAMGKAPVEAFGAVAGVKIDENGNVTFDPLKAVIGVAGFTAYKGMGKSKIPQAIYKDLSSISKAIKGKFISALKLDEIKTAIAITEDAVENMPGKNLMKYVSKTTGELPEVTGEATMKSLTGSGKTVKRSTFGQKGDDIVTEFGFKDLDDAREGLNAYRNSKGYLEALKVQAKQLVVERSAIRKGERLMEMAMGDRRMAYRAVRDRFGLSETDLAKIRRGRDIMSMEPKEFQDFMARAENMGAEIEKLREAKVKMFGTVNALDLHKWENVREVMKFPNISKMNVEQFNKLDEILSQYKTGDEFLPVRQLETINTTELKGIRTTREARDFLAKKFNIKPKDLPGIKPHPWMYDTQLARQHPLYDLLVTKYNESYLKATGRAIELERKADDLIKKARSSSKTTLGDYIAPTDKQIISWLESTDRVSLEKTMTLEQIQAAEYMDGVYKEYYDWLSKRALDKKFSSRFEDKYFPHVRRGFLETWKEDGFLQGVKQSFDQFKNEERMLTILDEKTGNILPYQKWIGFTQFRGEGLVPTQNASRAFKAYVTALEKARQFDEFIPEIMVYVHSLTPKGLTQRGVELDDSLNRFVKSWINSKKGRVQKQIITPGGKADWVLRMGVALTRIRDLGLNIPVGIANIFGEQAGNLTMLGAKNFTLGLGRFATKKGREITKKYANFVGKSIFESLAEASNTIGDKLLGGVFGVFSVSSRKANQVFLLGSMTADEFAKGTISLERLAQLRKNMGKYRVVEDSESIFGKSVEGAIGGQYKRWAIPIITSTASNAKVLSKMLLTKGVKDVLSSKEGSELFYSVILGSALGLGIMGYYNELSENKDRTFVEDIIFKSSRDSLSMIGALDPKFIGSFSAPRLSSLIIDLTTGLDHLIMLEKYKTTGELKGVSELKKALTPSLLTTLTKENNKTISGASKSQSSRKIKIPKGLPEIPELKSTLPKLPKLPMLP